MDKTCKTCRWFRPAFDRTPAGVELQTISNTKPGFSSDNWPECRVNPPTAVPIMVTHPPDVAGGKPRPQLMGVFGIWPPTQPDYDCGQWKEADDAAKTAPLPARHGSGR